MSHHANETLLTISCCMTLAPTMILARCSSLDRAPRNVSPGSIGRRRSKMLILSAPIGSADRCKPRLLGRSSHPNHIRVRYDVVGALAWGSTPAASETPADSEMPTTSRTSRASSRALPPPTRTLRRAPALTSIFGTVLCCVPRSGVVSQSSDPARSRGQERRPLRVARR